ncbi:MAG TPA: hypothetical protein VEL47_03250, partial [Myxococcota bacterium]|nr:hypothetical protein [Myxococcota bacterium]
MAKIDGQMNKMFESYTNASSDQGGKVSDQEAARLITRAEQVNNSGASSFRNRKKTAGKQSLKALFDKDPAAFTPESKKAIENYLRYGQLPTASARPEANYGRTSFSRSNPNIRTGFAPN